MVRTPDLIRLRTLKNRMLRKSISEEVVLGTNGRMFKGRKSKRSNQGRICKKKKTLERSVRLNSEQQPK